jgi:hypothetical protein
MDGSNCLKVVFIQPGIQAEAVEFGGQLFDPCEIFRAVTEEDVLSCHILLPTLLYMISIQKTIRRLIPSFVVLSDRRERALGQIGLIVVVLSRREDFSYALSRGREESLT